MSRLLMREYFGQWDIKRWCYLPNGSAYFVTPLLNPFLYESNNVKLFFELKWDFYRTLHKYGPLASCLNIKIYKKSKRDPWLSEMEAGFAIYHSDGKLLHECTNPFILEINKFSHVCYDRARFEHHMFDKTAPFYFTGHCSRLESNDMTFTCHLKFYDYPKERIILKNLQRFNRKNCSMYNSQILSDFMFKIGNKSLHAHKAILSTHSPVLARMVSGDFLEAKTNTVEIKDFTFEAFDCFLRYLYSGEIIVPAWRYLLELYALADKYDVSILKDQCTDYLLETMNEYRLDSISELAWTYSDSKLIKATRGIAYKGKIDLNEGRLFY